MPDAQNASSETRAAMPEGVLIWPMERRDAGLALAICQAGLDTGQASFETAAPAWEDFAAQAAGHRHVAGDAATGQANRPPHKVLDLKCALTYTIKSMTDILRGLSVRPGENGRARSAGEYGYDDLRVLMSRQAGDEKHDTAATSTLDVLWVLYDEVLRVSPDTSHDEKRDRFYLSKGHGPMAYYAVLAAKGFFPVDLLDGLGGFGSILGHHPDRTLVPGAEISSGSLGHGLPLAVGTALGLRARRLPGRVWVLVGDGELDEGSNHEAIAYAGRVRLDNLHVVVIDNGSADYGWPGGIERRFAVEDWSAVRVNGRDHAALKGAFTTAHPGRPHVVVGPCGRGRARRPSAPGSRPRSGARGTPPLRHSVRASGCTRPGRQGDPLQHHHVPVPDVVARQGETLGWGRGSSPRPAPPSLEVTRSAVSIHVSYAARQCGRQARNAGCEMVPTALAALRAAVDRKDLGDFCRMETSGVI